MFCSPKAYLSEVRNRYFSICCYKGNVSLERINICNRLRQEELPRYQTLLRKTTPITMHIIEKGSSSDSMMSELLRLPPSISVVDPLLPRRPSHDKSSYSSSDSMMRELLRPPQLITVEDSSLERRLFHDKRMRSVSSTSLLRQSSSEALQKTSFRYRKSRRDKRKKYPTLTINPYTVGVVAMLDVVTKIAVMEEEDRRMEEEMEGKERGECKCEVMRHPLSWTSSRIQDIHLYSYLLDCEDSTLSKTNLLMINSANTVQVYRVPLDHPNPTKTKAEEVLRYVDVEVGSGDQKHYNIRHYIQPSDRKVLIVVSRGRVVGIVVAEPLQNANRILNQTRSYMDLEEQPVPVRVGINRLWIHVSMRRRHLASVLCRLIGRYFYKKEKLKNEDFAFNDIFEETVGFAKVFLKTSKPPLYLNFK